MLNGRLNLMVTLTKKNCISNCADLKITKELLDEIEWNKDKIENRTANLIDEFFKIWDITKLNN